MSILFSPIDLRGIRLKNRIAMSPMCQYSAAADGKATDWHLVHYGSRAVGNTALVVLEATGVTPAGRISPFDLGLWSDDQIEPLKRMADFVKGNGAAIGIQLAHAGRKASYGHPNTGGKPLAKEDGGWQVVAPSNVPFADGHHQPHALSLDEVKAAIDDFVAAAKRAVLAGFDLIEIHAAHGYLCHQFLSPLSNNRTDSYGGSFENRIRFVTEIVTNVREVIPESMPLVVRISATDFVDNGWDIDQSVKLAAILKNIGVDLIDVSAGGLVPNAPIKPAPGYQLPFSARIRAEANIKVGGVGLITSPEQAELALVNQMADVVFIGRELLRNPYFALDPSASVGGEIEWPSQYLRAK